MLQCVFTMAESQVLLPPLEIASCHWHEVLAKSLGKLWEEQVGCDFTFVCRGGKELRAHSCVLQAVSVQLKQWVASCWAPKEFVYHMDAISSDALMMLLRFVYHGKFAVPTSAKLQEVKVLAESLKIDELTMAISDHSSIQVDDTGSSQGGNFIWPHKKARKYKILGGKEKGLDEAYAPPIDPGEGSVGAAGDLGSHHTLLPGPPHTPHAAMMGPVFPNSQPLPFGTPGHSAFAIPPRPMPGHNLVMNLSNQREPLQVDSVQHRVPIKPPSANHASLAQGLPQTSASYQSLPVNQVPAQEPLTSNTQGPLVLYVGGNSTSLENNTGQNCNVFGHYKALFCYKNCTTILSV